MREKFNRLVRKIKRNESRAHPNYSPMHIDYIAKARAGEVARMKKGHRCAMCGITH